MSLNAVIPFIAPQTPVENLNHSTRRRARKGASRKRRNRAKLMDSSPIRSLVPTPVPSIIYPEVHSVVHSPFDTPKHSPRGGSPAPDVEVNLEVPVESRAADLSGDGVEGLTTVWVTDTPVYQDNSPESSSSESTRSRTPSVGPTSSSSSSSAHSRSNSRSNTSSKSYASAASRRPRSVSMQKVRPHRRRSTSSPNSRYRLAAMNQARKKGRPVKYGVTRDLKLAFMTESGTVNIGKRPVFGCCVIQ